MPTSSGSSAVNQSQVLINATRATSIYDGLYYRLNQYLLRITGLWPYDSQRKIIRLFWMILLLVETVPHVTGIIVHSTNIDILTEHLVTTFILLGIFLKIFTLVLAENKMKAIYHNIANNWSMIIDEEEKEILVRYSKKGRNLTIFYVGLLFCANSGFLIAPLVPEILNAIDSLPIPRPHLYVLQGEFLIENRGDHYYKIYAFDCITVCSVVIIGMGVDSMYTVVVEHASALFAIVTHRLSKLRHKMINDSQDERDTSYEWLIHTIKLHQVILSFTDNINDIYSNCFFVLTIMNIVDLPILCVIILIHANNFVNCSRHVSVLISVMLHLFVMFWPGQKLINHSIRLINDAYDNEWYETPVKTRKILRIFMLRCAKPCIITAGGLIEMSFQVYLRVVKTAASYITVLASFR